MEEQAEQKELPDYKDWLSRFLSIYRYHYGDGITNVALAEEHLANQKFAQSDLDEIWRHHVARNIYRDKQLRERKPIKKDSHNVLLYLKKKLYLDPIPSNISWGNENTDLHACEKCSQTDFKSKVSHWIIVGQKWYCNRCYTTEFENDGVKVTSLSVLRDAFKRRTPQNTGEHLTDYLKRALRMGATNMKDRKTNKQENDIERQLERQAIESE